VFDRHEVDVSTKARDTFKINVTRASYFLDIHQEAQEGAGAPSAPYQELSRGAVVFAIGALDAYMSEVSAEVMVRDLQKALASTDVREVLKRIHADLPTLALEVALVPTQGERVQRIREAIVDHFQNRVSMHGAKAVAATAARVGARVADVWSTLGQRGYQDPQEQLDRWTDIRHQIVHQGRKPRVRRPQARDCIGLVAEVVDVLDGFASE
jgi:hypothetical protein